MLIFLFVNTELRQLLKLPVLIHHYLEHDADDEGLSFFQFLHEHYSEDHSPAKDKEHQSLPFKSHDLSFAQTALAYQHPVEFEYIPGNTLATKVNTIYSPAFHPTSIPSRIWQPPKYC